MKVLIPLYMVALFVLHQDFWLKDDSSLALGFLPSSLAYHMVFTALAGLGWFLVVKYAWPQFASEDENDETEGADS